MTSGLRKTFEPAREARAPWLVNLSVMPGYPNLLKTIMPIISTFFGIIIRMYFGDHNPPHFHVEFQGEKATFTLTVGCGLEIFLPGLPESWCGTGLVVIDSNS
jgi:Domain of unknown function (DUF4160)